jgi:hypothetical protein
VRGLERAGVLPAQPRERRRVAQGLRRDLGRRRETGGDGERRAVEEVASRNRGHARILPTIPRGPQAATRLSGRKLA